MVAELKTYRTVVSDWQFLNYLFQQPKIHNPQVEQKNTEQTYREGVRQFFSNPFSMTL